MQELDKGQDIAFKGPAARAALAACRRILADWQIALPPVEPLVLDFGLGDFERIGLIEFWIANERDAGYCGKYLFVFDGQTCPEHRHRSKHETFFLVRGHAELHCNGTVHELHEGAVAPVAPAQPHSFTGKGPALFLELSQPCVIADNYFTDVRIPIGGNHEPQTTGDAT
jgi:D-lyxose ketol-isomerase